MKTCTCGAVPALREVEKQYGKLHDMLSDCMESGRLIINLPEMCLRATLSA